MIFRLLVGCVVGLLVGAAVAALLVFGLGTREFNGTFSLAIGYAAAAVTGVLTGLVAGKPIWAPKASIEAGLKAFFGALLGTVALFAMRKWFSGVPVNLAPLGVGGNGAIGSFPATALPLLGAVLGALFELDNTGDKSEGGPPRASTASRTRVAGGTARGGAKASPAGAEASEESESQGRRAKN